MASCSPPTPHWSGPGPSSAGAGRPTGRSRCAGARTRPGSPCPAELAHNRAVTEPRTRIQLCGRLEIEIEGERLEQALPGRQGRLLFAYLALNRDRPLRRDELVEALWPGEGGPAAGES